MDKRRKDKKAKKALDLYNAGYSLAEIAKKIGTTRQSVHGLISVRDGYRPRKPKTAHSQYFNGRKYSKRTNGYYFGTVEPRTLMHRDVWEASNGKIPAKHDIHHIDHDRANNDITNLELYSKSEHARLFSTGHNQHTKKENLWQT